MDKFSLLSDKITVMQASMAGVSDVAFVASASQAGALGSLGAGMMSPEEGAGMMSPEEIRQAVADIRALTQKPFAVNFMILPQLRTQQYSQEMPVWLSDYYKKLGMECQLAKTPAYDFEA